MKLIRLAVASAAAGTLLLAGCSTADPQAPTTTTAAASVDDGSFVVTGTLSTDDRDTLAADCDTPTVTRIVDQDSVVVYDADDKRVATGTVGPGKAVGQSCEFPFAVEQVPSGSTVYSIEFADGQYRGFTFTEAKASAPLTIELDLG